MHIITITKKHKHRIKLFLLITISSAVILSLIMFALRENVNLFYTPSHVHESQGSKRFVRLGGMVVKDSINYGSGLDIDFSVTDFENTVNVKYAGILPDLFREEQGIVAEGKLNNEGTFIANRILAKHDENYMPPGMKTLNSKRINDVT